MSTTTRARARDYGVPFQGTPGPVNAITDVPGVEVGYETIVDGESTRTGVTAILPLGRAGVGTSCPAGWYSLNGAGEMTGTAWIDETGALDLPLTITNTNAVGPVHRGVIDWVVRERPDLDDLWHFPVVAETYDGYLNKINAPTVTASSAIRALDAAQGGPIAEGSVGGGTGMNLYGFKGGTGTASRLVDINGTSYTVGVLMQANFGARRLLTIAGRHHADRAREAACTVCAQ
jgi:D-aminopeptidase